MPIRKCNHYSCEYFRVLPNFRHVDLCAYHGQEAGDRAVFVEPCSDCQFGLLEQKAASAQSPPKPKSQKQIDYERGPVDDLSS